MDRPGLDLPPNLAQIEAQLHDFFRLLQNGFQKLDKVKDLNRQSKQLEELTVKMRECKRLIKEFDQIVKEEQPRNTAEFNKQINEHKQSLIKELNSYVTLRKTYNTAISNKKAELLGGTGNNDPLVHDNARMASTMTNQQLIDVGRKQMDETDQSIERSKKVVENTVNIGAQTAQTLKSQTEQMSRIVNELETIQFSIKKATQLVKEISRQLATDRCIMFFLFIIVCGVVAIIVVKVVHPNNKNIRNIPGLAPRKLLFVSSFGGVI